MTEKSAIIVANWKMYKTIEGAQRFIQELIPKVEKSQAKVCIAVPYTAIHQAAESVKNSSIIIGAQNMNDATEGAFTGEIAAKMLKEAGANFVILGHSERRHVFGEENAFINRKVKRALEEKIQPLLCIGETLKEKEEGKTEEVLERQISESLADVSAEDLENILIAYEPVWAIGTGKTATPESAEKAHAFCRGVIEKKWENKIAETVKILYGGSVKPENCKALLEQPNIDGLLVGGASLSVDSFSQIVNYQTVTD